MGATKGVPLCTALPADPIGLLLTAYRSGVRLLPLPPYWHPSLSTPEEVVVALETARPFLASILLGASTGHRWAPCEVCGEGCMVGGTGRPVCRLTPGCKGHHKPRSLPRGILAVAPVRRLSGPSKGQS
jgi:hypothetical protein